MSGANIELMPLVPPYIESRCAPMSLAESSRKSGKTYGLDRVAKLASNENPLGPSPLARGSRDCEEPAAA